MRWFTGIVVVSAFTLLTPWNTPQAQAAAPTKAATKTAAAKAKLLLRVKRQIAVTEKHLARLKALYAKLKKMKFKPGTPAKKGPSLPRNFDEDSSFRDTLMKHSRTPPPKRRTSTKARTKAYLAQPISTTGNQTIRSFATARKKMFSKVYTKGWRSTFYCGCNYSPKSGDRNRVVDWSVCGFEAYKNRNRARKVEAEHVVPASLFCNKRKYHAKSPMCIGKKNKKTGKPNKQSCRECAPKHDRQFVYMLADMYNLYPAIGEVNGDRRNYAPSILPGKPYRYGKCGIEIDDKSGRFEPPAKVRGQIARTYFYMARVYPLRFSIPKQLKALLWKWHTAHPVTKKECKRAKRIQKIQGNSNPILAGPCKLK